MSAARAFPPWLLAPLVVAVDFTTKRLVLAHEELLRQKVEVLGSFVRFVYVRNPGAAMGLLPVGRTVLIAVSLVVTGVLIYAYVRGDARRRSCRLAMAAIVGGALGNLIDRVFYAGLVVDFIDVGIGSHRFYTFNVADIAVTLGGTFLFICLLRGGAR